MQPKPSRMAMVAVSRGLGRAVARATVRAFSAVPPNCPTSTASVNCYTNLLRPLPRRWGRSEIN